MKILITTGIFPPDIGGPATQIEQLAQDLAKNGFEVAVLTYGNPEKKIAVVQTYKCFQKMARRPAAGNFRLKNIFIGSFFGYYIYHSLIFPGFLFNVGFQILAKKICGAFCRRFGLGNCV